MSVCLSVTRITSHEKEGGERIAESKDGASDVDSVVTSSFNDLSDDRFSRFPYCDCDSVTRKHHSLT